MIEHVSLRRFVRTLTYRSDFQWGCTNFKATLGHAIDYFAAKDILEIGGGRSPLLSDQEVSRLSVRYTVNDVSRAELEHAPTYVEKSRFDIGGPIPTARRYDLIFSRMVLEHLPNAKKAYENVLRLLCPGGVGIALFPTLYSLPFVINKFLPENLSSILLRRFFPSRNLSERPKFPAYYSWCYGKRRMIESKVRSLGFREANVLPFYGHDYFRKIPVLRELNRSLTRPVQKKNWDTFSSYAYSLVRK